MSEMSVANSQFNDFLLRHEGRFGPGGSESQSSHSHRKAEFEKRVRIIVEKVSQSSNYPNLMPYEDEEEAEDSLSEYSSFSVDSRQNELFQMRSEMNAIEFMLDGRDDSYCQDLNSEEVKITIIPNDSLELYFKKGFKR